MSNSYYSCKHLCSLFNATKAIYVLLGTFNFAKFVDIYCSFRDQANSSSSRESHFILHSFSGTAFFLIIYNNILCHHFYHIYKIFNEMITECINFSSSSSFAILCKIFHLMQTLPINSLHLFLTSSILNILQPHKHKKE